MRQNTRRQSTVHMITLAIQHLNFIREIFDSNLGCLWVGLPIIMSFVWYLQIIPDEFQESSLKYFCTNYASGHFIPRYINSFDGTRIQCHAKHWFIIVPTPISHEFNFFHGLYWFRIFVVFLGITSICLGLLIKLSAFIWKVYVNIFVSINGYQGKWGMQRQLKAHFEKTN